MPQTQTLDSDACFEVAARLRGVIAMLSEREDLNADDDLLYMRRLLCDALRITTSYAALVDEHASTTVHVD